MSRRDNLSVATGPKRVKLSLREWVGIQAMAPESLHSGLAVLPEQSYQYLLLRSLYCRNSCTSASMADRLQVELGNCSCGQTVKEFRPHSFSPYQTMGSVSDRAPNR